MTLQQSQCGDEGPAASGGPTVKVYPRRWLMLIMYMAVTMLNSVPWMQYTIIENVIAQYYNVSKEMVAWTVLVYNATAMTLIFPAAWVLDKYGVRASILFGVVGTVAGLWLRVLGVAPDRFWVVLLGQAVVSVSTNFLVSSLPPRFAVVWFPPHEVSAATGASLLVIMLGIAVGCAVAPFSAQPGWTPEEIHQGLLYTNLSLAIPGTVLLIAVFFFLKAAPPHPPSAAAAQSLAASTGDTGHPMAFLRSLRRICRDFHFVLLLVGSAIFSATFIGFTTLLNRAVTHFHPGHDADVGWLGMIITLTGIFGIIVCSVLLDKLRTYKEALVLIYVCALTSSVAYTVILTKSTIGALYGACAAMGMFMPCYYVAAYAMAIEITYPEPEGNPTAIINWLVQPLGMLITFTYGRVFEAAGPNVAHAVQCGTLAFGFLCALCVPKKYKRREAEAKHAKQLELQEMHTLPEAQPLTDLSKPDP